MIGNEDQPTEFDWLEWHYAEPNDPLHDSGFRYLSVVGVVGDVKHHLGSSADHIQVYGGVNMDVTMQGVMRIMPNTGKLRMLIPGFMMSDALFVTTEPDRDAALIETMGRVGKGDSDVGQL
jgi:hypothetical protein